MKTQIGTITLKRAYRFTQYSVYAAWTDYVTCEPQTVPLWYDGYWAFASFDGILTEHTFGKDPIRDGKPAWKAHVQTQAFGGLGNWLNSDLFSVQLSNEYEMQQAGTYGPGCTNPGSPILRLAKRAQTPCPA